mmetsp:Transcript_18945/g.34329  ORF Transcript_18945/g.34329 Transcript_18945/m.34329 type:complete len:233 (-) Transcript_18945:1983-2681(-)
MMSAVKILTFNSSANATASLSMGTSNARMVANCGRPFWCMRPARITSRLKIGPIATACTGMGGLHSFRRNSRSASRAPRVEAWANTPSASVARLVWREAKSFMTSSLISFKSSPFSGEYTMIGEPATACSRPCAQILTPIAALMLSWLMYWALMRSSRFGGGVSSARAWATTGPSVVHTTSWSPAFISPLTRITSTVHPRPSITFTSSTVHCRVAEYMRLDAMRSWVKRTIM